MKKIACLLISCSMLLSGVLFGATTPVLLVWAVYEMPQKPAEIIDNDSINPAQKLLQQYATAHAVPIIFPMMDLTDLNAVSINDINTMALAPLQKAAQRYDNNGMLILRITQSASGYEIHALLSQAGDPLQWNLQDPTLDGVLSLLIDQVADARGQHNKVESTPALRPALQTEMQVKVIGVNQQSDFLGLQTYLQQLPIVSDVDVVQVSGPEIVLSLKVRGNKQSLTTAIAVDKKLLPVTADATNSALTYQWNP